MREELENDAEMLRATSDGLVIAIAEVDARERQKRGVPPADPSFPTLAREVRVAAELVLELAQLEELKANETVDRRGQRRRCRRSRPSRR